MKRKKNHEFRIILRNSVNEEIVHSIFASSPDQFRHRLETFLDELRAGVHEAKKKALGRQSGGIENDNIKVSFVGYIIVQHKNKTIDCEITEDYRLIKWPAESGYLERWYINAFNMTK